jgi:O-antigen/teichoic acid export membrane protein
MLLRQTLLYLPAQVVGPIAQFISVILWTYFLSPQEMGVFALVSAAQEFTYLGALFWFTLFTMRFFDKNAKAADRKSFLDTESGVLAAGNVLTTLAVLTLPLFIDAEWNVALVTAALAYCIARTIATHLTDRARTASDTLTYTVLQITWPVLGLALGLIFIKVWGPVAASVLWGYAAAQMIALLYAIRRLEISVEPFALSPQMVRNAMRYGMPLVAGGLFVWLANNGIRFVIEGKAGSAAVGLVTVGWGLGLRAAAFSAMLVTAAAFPLAVAKAREQGMPEGQKQLVQNGILLFAILAPAAAGLWSISAPLVERIVAAPYREMTAAVLPWAIIAGAARNLRIHFAEQVFLLREETMVPLANDALDGILTLAGGAIGLATHGLQGCVAGASIGALVSLAVTLASGAYWHKYTFPPGHLLRIGAATLAMFGVLSVVPVAPVALSLAFAIALGGAVYCCALLMLYPDAARGLIAKARALRRP